MQKTVKYSDGYGLVYWINKNNHIVYNNLNSADREKEHLSINFFTKERLEEAIAREYLKPLKPFLVAPKKEKEYTKGM